MSFDLIHVIKDIYRILNKEQKYRLYKIQIFVIFSSVIEVVALASVPVFLNLLLGGGIRKEEIFLHLDFINIDYGGLDYIFILASLVLILVVFSALCSIYTLLLVAGFAARLGSELSAKLYNYYLQAGWLFHVNERSSQLSRKLAHETQRVTGGILNPLMQMNAKIVQVLGILLFLAVYNFVVTMVIAFVYGVTYLLIYKYVRSKLNDNGYAVSEQLASRYRLMANSFGLIREIELKNSFNHYGIHFENAGIKLAEALKKNIVYSQAPRYLIELVTFSLIILTTAILYRVQTESSAEILSGLSVFALAALKVLPAFQQVYSNMATIKADAPAFFSLKEDFINSFKFVRNSGGEDLPFEKSIVLKNVSFKYPNSERNTINDISLEIKKHSSIAFVGPSGGGKSTLVDLLAGLMCPNHGCFIVDGIEINENNINSWKNKIGIVSQQVFLIDGSLLENIVTDNATENCDIIRVYKILDSLGLKETVNSLPFGLNTQLGENGVQLSGGQRQRVALARVMYEDPEILVFDEATSALDNKSQAFVIDAIQRLSRKKTIITIAHRLETIKHSDCIYLLEKGSIIASGDFRFLSENSPEFRDLNRIGISNV